MDVPAEIKPDDGNAAKYLQATKDRMAQLGLRMLAPSARTPPKAADLYRAAGSAERQHASQLQAQPASGFKDNYMDAARKTLEDPDRHQSGMHVAAISL